MHVGDSGVEHSWPHARLLLNSKRLTTGQIKRVGRALGVPTDASVDEICVMIEGKLREMECDPANVQVVVGGTSMSLCGEDREFLLITEPPSTETSNDKEGDQDSPDEASPQELEQLQTELQDAKAEILTLKETISSLQTQVDQSKDRIRQMWRDNCRYVAEIDEELSRKDNEIRRLQENIQGLQATVSAGGHATPLVVPTEVATAET